MIVQFKIFENSNTLGYLVVIEDYYGGYIGRDVAFNNFIKNNIALIIEKYKEHYFLVEYVDVPRWIKDYFGGENNNRLSIVNTVGVSHSGGKYLKTNKILFTDTKQQLEEMLLISKEIDKYNL